MNFGRQHVELMRRALEALIVGVVTGIIVFILAETVPLYMKNYQLEQAARSEARLVVVSPRSASSVQSDLYQKAQEIGAPVQIDQIRVHTGEAIPSSGTLDTVLDPSAAEPRASVGVVNIDISYAVPLKFPGHTFELRFHVHADDRSI